MCSGSVVVWGVLCVVWHVWCVCTVREACVWRAACVSLSLTVFMGVWVRVWVSVFIILFDVCVVL